MTIKKRLAGDSHNPKLSPDSPARKRESNKQHSIPAFARTMIAFIGAAL
jgi:hypothetical protein